MSTRNDCMTRGRKTRVRFDVPDYALTEPPFALTRDHYEMAQGKSSKVVNCVDLMGIGWTLSPINTRAYRRENNDSSVYSPTISGTLGLFVAPNHDEYPTFRKPAGSDGYTGIVADSSVHASGNPMLQKQIAAGVSWSQSLTADQSAFPGPTESSNFPLERVAVTAHPHLPGTGLFFTIDLSGHKLSSVDKVARVYFSAVAGVDDVLFGFGQYCASIWGDGAVWLYERGIEASTGNTIWQARAQYSPSSAVDWSHAQEIHIDSWETKRGTVIDIQYVGIGGVLASFLGAMSEKAIPGSSKLYHVPNRNEPPSSQVQPARIDVRQDLRAPFQLAQVKYHTSGVVSDDIWHFPFQPTSSIPFSVYYYATIPDGCSVSVNCYSWQWQTMIDGTENYFPILQTPTVTGPGWAMFDTDPLSAGYSVSYHLSGTGESNPVLHSYTVSRNGRIEDLTGYETSIEGAFGGNVSITGPDADPTHETCHFGFSDLKNQANLLNYRASMPIAIETDNEQSTAPCVLFRGYNQRTESTPRYQEAYEGSFHTGHARNFPNPNWHDYVMTCLGQWQRLKEAQIPVNYYIGETDPNAPINIYGTQSGYKITDVLRKMFSWAGYPDEMIDIPDSDIRFVYDVGGLPAIIHMFTPLDEIIQKLAKDYLGWYIYFDANAGTRGKWKVLAPSTPPYTYKAAFTMSGPGTNKLAQSLHAYPLTLTDSGNVPTAPILAPSFKSWVKPPEANNVLVFGYASPTQTETSAKAVASQWLCNVRSFNFAGLATDHANYPKPYYEDGTPEPDYIGRSVPIVVIDSSLHTTEAINFVAYRLYATTCHAVKMCSFESPLILVPHEDDPTRVRPLRYYDPVLVNGNAFLVRSVNPGYDNDEFQKAVYELQAPTEEFLIG